MKKELLSEKIRVLADSLGIDALGFAGASEFSNYVLRDSMRRDPKLSLPGAKSIIVAGIYIGGLTLSGWADPRYGRTSRLYLSEFFLDVVKPVEPIADFIKSEGYQAIVCSSGSILPLKLAAVRAGLGWQGKHSLLISKTYGTFLALGGIITDAALENNTRIESNRCGKCDKCQKSCPLAALDQPYVLNRKKCMSNLLQAEKLPDNVRNVMENRIVDCEICQQVCPWNMKHITNPLATKMTESFQNRIEDREKLFFLPDLIKLSEKDYMEKLGHLKTDIPYNIFHRNVKTALENAERDCNKKNE